MSSQAPVSLSKSSTKNGHDSLQPLKGKDGQDLEIGHIYEAIQALLVTLGYSYQKPKDLANCILKTSEYYIQRSGVSPWSSPQFCAAYLAHFLPMNIMRVHKGLERLKKLDSHRSYFTKRPIVDYGCGPMTFLFAYLLAFKSWPVDYKYYDTSNEGPQLGLQVLKRLFPQEAIPVGSAQSEPKDISENDLVCLSYSFNELSESQKASLVTHNHLLIFEPAMRNTSRELLGFRKTAIGLGHKVLAPCTHNMDCPLLEQSQKDWCFDRVHLEIPEIATELYKLLPFDNAQATFSYLFLSRTLSSSAPEDPNNRIARIVGDTQKEKGKARTMICRNDQREFLSILKKQRLDLKLHRGDSFTLPHNIEVKGSEIRLTDLA